MAFFAIHASIFAFIWLVLHRSNDQRRIFKGIAFHSKLKVANIVPATVDVCNNEKPYMSIDMMTLAGTAKYTIEIDRK